MLKNCYILTTSPNHEIDPGLVPSPLKGTHVGHLHNDPYFYKICAGRMLSFLSIFILQNNNENDATLFVFLLSKNKEDSMWVSPSPPVGLGSV